MTVDEPAAPIRRFAAGPLVAEVNERTGSALRLVGMAGHGEQGGAAYVDWPDGRPGVLTRTATAITELRRTAEVLELARAHGLPVPRHHLIVPLRDNTAAVVQERLPGAPVRHADAGVIDALVAMNDRFAGLLADRRDVEVPPLYLRRSGPAYWRHESLARYDDRTRQLLDQIRGIGAAGPHEMLGDDLVHRDYTLGNILFNHAGRVTGVVDWNEGVARGDRRFALVGLLFDLSFSILLEDDQHGIEQSAIDRLTEILRESSETVTAPRLLGTLHPQRARPHHQPLSTRHGRRVHPRRAEPADLTVPDRCLHRNIGRWMAGRSHIHAVAFPGINARVAGRHETEHVDHAGARERRIRHRARHTTRRKRA